MVRAVVVAIPVVSLLLGCAQQATPTPSVSVATSSPTLPPPSSRPAATATLSPTDAPQTVLPNPGGTCSADRFVITAPATVTYGFGTAFTTSVYVRQPLRNTGGACVIRLPAKVGVTGPDGRVAVVSAVNAGNATSFKINAGQTLAIELGAWWPLPNAPDAATWCRDPVPGVTRASFPLATGVIVFDLGVTVREACPSPASMSVTVTP